MLFFFIFYCRPLLLQHQSCHKHARNHKTPGVCFYPIFSEVVSPGKKMLKVIIFLLFLHSQDVFQQSRSYTHAHTHILPPSTAPLIDYQTATQIAFYSRAPLLFSFSAPLVCGGRLIIVGLMLGQNEEQPCRG